MVGHEGGLRGEGVAAELQDGRVVRHVRGQPVEHLPDHLGAGLGPVGHLGGHFSDLLARPVQVSLGPGQDRVRVGRCAQGERQLAGKQFRADPRIGEAIRTGELRG